VRRQYGSGLDARRRERVGAPPGDEFGTRTETKNVNSVRFVMAVVESEAKRQVALIEDGGKVVQETRLYDPDRNETRSMRSKEDAHDYRYFPDPDLLPLVLTMPSWRNAARPCPNCPMPSVRVMKAGWA
jgi:aspartyl-tRNA(Asn)/glutamyl-tRNA(Gln) amidotransferase subunit B